MAWYCDQCQRFVDGKEVSVGELGKRDGRYHKGVPYHHGCLQPVRAVRDEPHPAPTEEANRWR